tara:strand:- start:1454 stop:1681 length:228 start_codon:yes stop_codon:yes gene_type:complete
MAGKNVGIDWYKGAYAVLEKIQGKLIPIETSTNVYDCIRYACTNYDHLDSIDMSDSVSEIAVMEAQELTKYKGVA